jgi:hypothetical protein
VAIGLEVKRQDRIAGDFRQPNGAGLGDPSRAARAVNRKSCRPIGDVSRQL